MQVIVTFSMDDNALRLRHYVCIGWGFPLIIIVVWASLVASINAVVSSGGGNNSTANNSNGSSAVVDTDLLMVNNSCPFVGQGSLEYVYIVPILFVLGLNTFFLVWIMWVVISKLRSSAMAEEHDHQVRNLAVQIHTKIPYLTSSLSRT